MKPDKFDEEGLLKEMEISELSLKISKLTFGWNNYTILIQVLSLI